MTENDLDAVGFRFEAKFVKEYSFGGNVHGMDIIPRESFDDGNWRIMCVDWSYRLYVIHENGKKEKEEKFEGKQPDSVILLNDNHFIVGTRYCSLVIYEILSNGSYPRVRKFYFQHFSYFWDMILISNNRALVAGGSSAKVGLFECFPKRDHHELSEFTPELSESVIYQLHLSKKDHDFVLSAESSIGSKSNISVWSISKKKRVRTIATIHKREVLCLDSYLVGSDEEYIVSGSHAHNLLVYDFSTGNLQFEIEKKNNGGFRSFLKYTDRFFICGDKGGNLGIFDILTRKYIVLDKEREKENTFNWINRIKWVDKATKRQIVYCSNENVCRLFEFDDKLAGEEEAFKDEKERLEYIKDVFLTQDFGQNVLFSISLPNSDCICIKSLLVFL